MNLNLLQLNTARFISQRKKRQLLGKICLVSRFCHFQLNIYKFTSSFILTVTFTQGLYLLSAVFYSTVIRPRKKNMFLVRISTKKRAGVRYFFFFFFFLLFLTFLLFPIECFLYTLLPYPRDQLEFLGKIFIKCRQILIKDKVVLF